jgi:hypothetical protein
MAPSQQIFSTPLTRLFDINHPVMLAGRIFFLLSLYPLQSSQSTGMNVASGPRLAAAVTNAGRTELKTIIGILTLPSQVESGSLAGWVIARGRSGKPLMTSGRN